MSTCAPTCLYCDMPLSTRHEHDHFPVPKSAGGDQTSCVCVNCHDLKDRVGLDKWDAPALIGALVGLWKRANPTERILLARMFRVFSDGSK